jgi:hypothetical protein
MKKLTVLIAAVIAIGAAAALWKRNRRSVQGAWDEASGAAAEIGHELGNAARQAGKTANEVSDDLKNAAREAGKAADAASRAADELNEAFESPSDRTP